MRLEWSNWRRTVLFFSIYLDQTVHGVVRFDYASATNSKRSFTKRYISVVVQMYNAMFESLRLNVIVKSFLSHTAYRSVLIGDFTGKHQPKLKNHGNGGLVRRAVCLFTSQPCAASNYTA